LQLMDLEELRFDLLALKMRCPRHLHILTAVAFSLPLVLTLSLSTIIQDFPCIDYDMFSALQVPQHAGGLLNSQAQCFLLNSTGFRRRTSRLLIRSAKIVLVYSFSDLRHALPLQLNHQICPCLLIEFLHSHVAHFL